MKKILVFLLTLLTASVNAKDSSTFTLNTSELMSNEQLDNKYFADQFGCNGGNIRPALSWKNSPKNTKSFAITLYDHDAPTGSGLWHWVLIDIPKSVNSLKENQIPNGSQQQLNDIGSTNWLGPCPPEGNTHHYEIKIHALDIEKLPTKLGNSAALTGFFIYMHSIASASKILTVSR